MRDMNGIVVVEGDVLHDDKSDVSYFYQVKDGKAQMVARAGIGILEAHTPESIEEAHQKIKANWEQIPWVIKSSYDANYSNGIREVNEFAKLEKDSVWWLPVEKVMEDREVYFNIDMSEDRKSYIITLGE